MDNMTNLLNISGWMIVGLAIAWLICVQKKKAPKTAGNADVLANPKTVESEPSDHSWCAAIEALTTHATLIFDASLKVVSAGAGAERMLGRGKTIVSRHLMDIFPSEAASKFLERLADVRRDGAGSWQSKIDGKDVEIAAALRGEDVVVTIGDFL